MDKRPRTVTDNIVEFVAATELRRLFVVVGIPVIFVTLVYEQNILGTVVLLLAAGLATFLYTRTTTQKTVAASAYATGTLLIGLVLLELYWNWTQAGTASQAAIVTENHWQPVAGTVMIGLGLWLRQTEV